MIEGAWRGREPTYGSRTTGSGPPARSPTATPRSPSSPAATPAPTRPPGRRTSRPGRALPMGDARRAYAAIAPELEEVEVLGRRAWLARGARARRAARPPAAGLRRHPARPPRPRPHRPPRARPRRPARRRHPAPDRARGRARRGHLALRPRHPGDRALRPARARRRRRGCGRRALPRGLKSATGRPIVSCGGSRRRASRRTSTSRSEELPRPPLTISDRRLVVRRPRRGHGRDRAVEVRVGLARAGGVPRDRRAVLGRHRGRRDSRAASRPCARRS